MDWPDLNSLALIDIVGEAVTLETRVDALEPALVTLTPAGPLRATVLPAPGKTVLIAWSTLRGHHERMGVVETSLRAPRPQITVRPVEAVRRLQRRSHVRVPQLNLVDLHVDGRRVRASLLDVSESGVRCVLDLRALIAMDAVVTVTLDLIHGVALDVQCKPTRMSAIDADHVEIGLTFVNLHERAAYQIRKHVCAQQIRDRAMGLL